MYDVTDTVRRVHALAPIVAATHGQAHTCRLCETGLIGDAMSWHITTGVDPAPSGEDVTFVTVTTVTDYAAGDGYTRPDEADGWNETLWLPRGDYARIREDGIGVAVGWYVSPGVVVTDGHPVRWEGAVGGLTDVDRVALGSARAEARTTLVGRFGAGVLD